MPFEELYHQYFESIYKYTYRITGHGDQAEDMTEGFTLKAPKIQVKDLPSRVKLTVLSKLKE